MQKLLMTSALVLSVMFLNCELKAEENTAASGGVVEAADAPKADDKAATDPLKDAEKKLKEAEKDVKDAVKDVKKAEEAAKK